MKSSYTLKQTGVSLLTMAIFFMHSSCGATLLPFLSSGPKAREFPKTQKLIKNEVEIYHTELNDRWTFKPVIPSNPSSPECSMASRPSLFGITKGTIYIPTTICTAFEASQESDCHKALLHHELGHLKYHAIGTGTAQDWLILKIAPVIFTATYLSVHSACFAHRYYGGALAPLFAGIGTLGISTLAAWPYIRKCRDTFYEESKKQEQEADSATPDRYLEAAKKFYENRPHYDIVPTHPSSEDRINYFAERIARLT